MVLALADDPTSWRYGYELCQLIGLKAGSMYPILIRLADRGLLETMWENEPPAGRPPRHLYRLTGPGLAVAADFASQPVAKRVSQRDPIRAQPQPSRRTRPRLRTERA